MSKLNCGDAYRFHAPVDSSFWLAHVTLGHVIPATPRVERFKK